MSVNSYLTNLASTLILSETEKSSITTSINTLSSRLTLHFNSEVTKHFQFGSSTRGTILPRKADNHSDIDYMVVFNTSNGRKKPQTYLNRLKRFVEARYSTSEIRQSHPTIVLSLNHINFELVPAIYNYGYHIPLPASSWLEWTSTDPSGTNQLLQDTNKSNNYHIKPLVRLVKYWNTCKRHPFTSFSLEQYIVNQSFLRCSALKDYFYEFWLRFNCTYDTARNIKNMVEKAKAYARNAKEYESINMPVRAESEIKKILPSL
ncbi:MAG: nucleotidyltransferase domain-containing protein [Jaaginema sp. PMC 1079.18]|nr:nucleotidyltransferase domain-containing protein [Jaaginema sp. PMC 1080.18]MEC4852419.1 nucleotidyltransferase domain-containing protein [Jaaginema sp. PMC 1079.18]MEC4868294.1 nucleotidyltransferase domain-containing protein [Jaaginema sp. PMC 1078.18]